MSKNKRSYRVEFLYRPGATWPDEQLAQLVSELRGVASTCFDEVPNYQCLAGTREELADKVITVARRPGGPIVGFCSAVLLPVSGVGDVLHLGLTCVRPEHRGMRLTHRLTAKLVLTYYRRYRWFGKLWCTNVACVLSSLGNVALGFDNVFPSPFGPEAPTMQHLRIAQAIDEHYRHKAFIAPDARFDAETFVFAGSVKGTVFEKDGVDTRYHHRLAELNRYYGDRLSFGSGDEVLQVAHVSSTFILKYLLDRTPKLLRALWPQPQANL